QCRPDAMTGNIPKREKCRAIGPCLPVVVVAAGLVSGETPTFDFVSGHVWLGGWQQPALDFARDVQIALDARSRRLFGGKSIHVRAQLGCHPVEACGKLP